MTASKNAFAAKFGVIVVAVAMLFTFAAPAQAQQTTEELRDMINQLLQQIDALQAQVGQTGTAAPAGVCPYTWTRNLGQGDRGEDVMRLQQLLNSDPETRVAASGVGSAGQETEFYGPMTAAAVSTMQMKYRAEVLTPGGLVNPTGFFGPATRAKANALCAEPVMPEPEDEDEMEEEEEEAEDPARAPLSSNEATIDRFRVNSGEFGEAREGQRDVPVAEIEFDVEDGDISVNRLDLAFRETAGSPSENRPWETFRSVALWVNGDKVAEVDADRRADWSRGTPSGWDRLRMSGLDIVFREGERAEIVVAVSVLGTVRGVNVQPADWEVTVPDNGFRGRDGAGIDSFEGDTGATSYTTSFLVEEAGADDELRVRTSNNDPSATTFEVEKTTRSNFEDIFAFDLDTRDSDNEIEIFTIPLSMTLSGGNYADIVNDLRLVVDGVTYRDFTVNPANGVSTSPTITFEFDDELFISPGDRVGARLQARFNSQEVGGSDRYDNGATIMTSVSGDDITAEGANTLASNQKGGSATSETHTLRTEGIMVDLVSSSQQSVSPSNDVADTYGEFTMRVDVTAIGDDMVINETGVRLGEDGGAADLSDWDDDQGIAFTVRGSNNSIVTTGDESVSFTRVSGGTRVGSTDAWRISEGSTATFEVVVTFNPATAAGGQHRIQLEAAGFQVDGAGAFAPEVLTPAADFRSGQIFIASDS